MNLTCDEYLKEYLDLLTMPLTMPKPLTVWTTINCGKFSERDGNSRPPDLPLEKPVCRAGSNR